MVWHRNGGRISVLDPLHQNVAAPPSASLRRRGGSPTRPSSAHPPRPDSTRSLANRHLDPRHIDFIMQPTLNFVGGSAS